ncbi:MAG: PEP-CTERM sorting domain-containing protein [Planctomycetales bacterium]|nr:PEP-CTERM sorting domain-containing protein [Planctomycetales bacterium]
MKSLFPLLGVLFLVTTSHAQNLLQDPSFDASTPNSQTNPFWTLDVTFPDGVGSSAQYQDAPWASNPTGTPGVGVWLKAFEGNQAGGGDPLANATLYQDVTEAAAGEYTLSFFYRKEANFSAANTYVELLEDGSRIGLLDLTEVDTGGLFEQFSFNANSSGGTLRVQAKMVDGFDAQANPQSAMFDDFSLTAVPEPSGFAMLALAGFALAPLRRRKR